MFKYSLILLVLLFVGCDRGKRGLRAEEAEFDPEDCVKSEWVTKHEDHWHEIRICTPNYIGRNTGPLHWVRGKRVEHAK